MIDAVKLLEIWEQGRSATPLERIFLLLRAGLPGWSAAEIGRLTLGEKEAQMLRLRDRIFGGVLPCVVACPRCGELLEFEFSAADLGAFDYRTAAQPETVEIEGRTFAIRPLTLNDLQRARGQGQKLLTQALEPLDAAEEVPGDAIDQPETAAAVAQRLQIVDPLMHIELDCDCPACDNRWSADFSAITYVWAEIERWGQNMLQTVHLLARTYGWAERDILQMSAWRRQQYVEMVA